MRYLVLIHFFACLVLFVHAQSAADGDHPKVIEDPSRYYHYSEHSRKFTGISSIAVTDGGTLWATWYAGLTPEEDANNYVVLAQSVDGGATWDEKLVIDPDGKGPLRAFDPEVWISPDNRLWLFWSQKERVIDGTAAKLWTMVIDQPEQAISVYGAPSMLTDGVMMCKPIVLSNGDWMLPVSTWRHSDYSAQVVVSNDQGKSWKVRGACDIPIADRDFDEHMVVERKDKTLWMLVRTKYGIGESISEDQGKTWSPLKPSSIRHTNSRFFISRLSSGNLLLVKHGPIELKTGRSHLMAFISKDDGRAWSKGLLLDERLNVSYPDGQQATDGTIYITYDYARRAEQHILLTHFSEEAVLSPDHDVRIINVFKSRSIISNGGNE